MSKTNSQRKWTDYEIDLLRRDYPSQGAEAIGYALVRSRHSVANKAHDLGLRTIKNPVRRGSGKQHGSFKGYEEISGTYIKSVKDNAAKRDLEFSITLEHLWHVYLQQKRKCALSGLPIIFSSKVTAFDGTASLDRIDSSKGYVVGNVQWVHKDINQMKWHFEENVFVHYCRAVAETAKPKMLPFMGSWTPEAASKICFHTVYGK